jgi:hypothetical protein
MLVIVIGLSLLSSSQVISVIAYSCCSVAVAAASAAAAAMYIGIQHLALWLVIAVIMIIP